jgi:hypothetical protein
MNVRFVFDPRMEVYPLRLGRGGANSSKQTPYYDRALAAQVVLQDDESVEAFVLDTIAQDGIDIQQAAERISGAWESVAAQVGTTFAKMFDTTWQPDDVTAYLTLSTRCPYQYPSHFWIYYATTLPVASCLHELQHFYAHKLLLPIFEKANKKELFNDFKEALTVLLNVEFANVIERKDEGYDQHADLRRSIETNYREGVSVADMARMYISGDI